MAMKDEFDPNDPLPIFLSDEPEPGIGRDGAVISPRFVIASILVATAIGVSILSARNPVTLFSDVTASVDSSAPKPGADEPMPSIRSAAIQSTADAEAPQTAKDAPTGEVSAPEPAGQTEAENSEASSEALFREFQAWNAKQNSVDLAKPVQDDPASVAENATEAEPAVQKQPKARAIRIARAEVIRHARKRRASIRRRNELAQARPVTDARAQTQPVQYAEPPSFLERLNPFAASQTQR